MNARLVSSIAFIATLGALFALALQLPVRPAEATAALAAFETCHVGDAIVSRQLGDFEPRRLPLHGWVLSSLAGGQPHRVSVTTARWVSLLAIVFSAIAGAAAFGTKRRLTAALILATPAIWVAAMLGTPGALLAMLLTFAWTAYEAGRRFDAPTLQWTLPPILGATASLVWSPAILLVALGLSIESVRLVLQRRRVAWARLAMGAIGSVALIGLWQMAYAGFVPGPADWWSRMTADFWMGDPVLAARGLPGRWTAALGVLMPAIVLAVLGRRRPEPFNGNTEVDTPLGIGTAVAALATILMAILAPGVPPAVTIPAGIVAIGLFARDRTVADRPQESWSAGPVVVVALLALVAMNIKHTRWGEVRLDTSRVEAIETDVPVVIDRELDPRETWVIVSRLGRPARRSPPYDDRPAWYVGPRAVGPGISIEGPLSPEAWSLLGRPLERPDMPRDTRQGFEQNLETARARFETNPRDALGAIWVGRRLAYLGRYREALAWFDGLAVDHPDDSRVLRHRGHRYISVRELDRAIHDLTRAADLERGRPDRVEPDGLPNAAGIPRSTTQTNIWYHLGLAYYLKGDLEQTVRCFRRCAELAPNDDMWVAAAHWLHIGLRRLDRGAEAAELLEGLHDGMEILENDSYRDLLMLYAGRLTAEALQERLDRNDGPGQAALAYGLARWLEDRGERERAEEAYRSIVARAPWAAFGAIAAEAEQAHDLARTVPIW